jgi:hypothetical protein
MLFIAQAMIIVHLVIYFDCWSLRLAFLFNRILKIGINSFLNLLFIINRKQGFNVSIFEPLSPHKVAFLKRFLFALYPPCTLLKDLFDEHVIVSTTNIVFICSKCLISLYILFYDTISFINCVIKGSEHLLSDS